MPHFIRQFLTFVLIFCLGVQPLVAGLPPGGGLDLFWWSDRDRGESAETVRPVEIEAGGGLVIGAGEGIVIEQASSQTDETRHLEQLSHILLMDKAFILPNCRRQKNLT